MCACNLGIVEGIGSSLVLWLLRLLSLHHRGNWIKIIVFRIANPYIILRQITNLPQLKRNCCAALVLSLRCHLGILKMILLLGGTEAAAVVLAVRCGRSRAAIDGGAARGVTHFI